MAAIIAVVNQKGGVGKTTTAVNLGAALAREGKFVLVVDMDPQANATSGLGINHRGLAQSIYHALIGDAPFAHVVQPTRHDGFRVAPANADLAGAHVEFVGLDRREWKLSDALREAVHAYDYIIIDSPPSLGMLTVNTLVAADYALIPVQAEYFALEGLGQLVETVGLVRDNVKPGLKILGAVVTMFDSRNRLSNEVLEEMYQYFHDTIFRTVIPRTVRLAEAPSFGQTIFEYAPGGRGAKAYERLAKEVEDQVALSV